jgi:segregation and condensation protein B
VSDQTDAEMIDTEMIDTGTIDAADEFATAESSVNLADDTVESPESSSALHAAIEAILLVAHEPVTAELMAQLLEQPTARIEDVCEQLAQRYTSAGHGFELVRVAGGYRYQTRAELSAYVERFLLNEQRARLSGAALETLAIVAYKQPISRAQIASIRGVDPDGVLRTLMARGYVDEVGRDHGPGQAVLFGTTAMFLDKLGLDSVDDLPPIAEFIPGADVVEALDAGLSAAQVQEPPAPPASDSVN